LVLGDHFDSYDMASFPLIARLEANPVTRIFRQTAKL